MVTLVAVPGRLSPKAEGVRTPALAAGQTYLRAVRRAGAEAAVVLPESGLAAGYVVDVLGRFDGLLLLGGGDLDPATFGAPPHEKVYGVQPEHDAYELAALRAALHLDLPILAICRGLQVLNVALGGTLHQHITETETTVQHRNGLHEVHLVDGSRTAVAMGTTRPVGWSQHHQAVDLVGEGLTVAGRAADGTVEALEYDHSWVVAVQWHPEDTAADDPEQQRLFDAFVAECRVRRRR